MRELLVKTANSLRKISDDAIWAKLTIEKIKNEYNKINNFFIPVITDLRFVTEYRFLQSNFDLFLIYVENDCKECKSNYENKDEFDILYLKDNSDYKVKLPCFENINHDFIEQEREKVFNKIRKKIKI